MSYHRDKLHADLKAIKAERAWAKRHGYLTAWKALVASFVEALKQ